MSMPRLDRAETAVTVTYRQLKSARIVSRGSMMKKERLRLFLLGLIVLLVGVANAQQGPSTCQDRLPEKLRSEITKKFRSSKIEETSDLAPEYREMWVKAHSSDCPGVAVGKYKGAGRSLFGVLLVSTDPAKPGAKLLVVDPASGNRFLVLETVGIATASPNVIYTLPPGAYADPEGGQKVRIPYDGVVLEQLEVGSILYYYRAGTFHKLILSE
jgi:hypothetical protein